MVHDSDGNHSEIPQIGEILKAEKMQKSIVNHVKRIKATCVKFTIEEFEKVKQMQKTTGLSIPDLLRKALLSREDLQQPLISESDREQFITELNRQGNNLNQIAHKINEGNFNGWSADFNRLTIAYFNLRKLIKEKYGNR